MCIDSHEFHHDRRETVVVPHTPLTGVPEWITDCPLLPYSMLELLSHRSLADAGTMRPSRPPAHLTPPRSAR